MSDDTAIVRQDLMVALTNVSVGIMLAGTVAFTATLWWVGVVVAVVTGVLAAAADRSRRGNRLLIGVAVLSLVAVVWAWATDVLAIGIVPVGMIGIGVGFSCNRILFGVVRPVPPARYRREQPAS